MKVAVIGATGRIGSRLTGILTTGGHRVTGHARSTGVDLHTGGPGVADALTGADAVVDVTRSPTVDEVTRAFFETTTGTSWPLPPQAA